MMTNQRNKVLYTGVTNSLARRTHEHKTGVNPKSFCARYRLHKLVYVEAYDFITDAIAREKQIKGGSRAKKEQLINSYNPDWNDLSDRIMEW